MPIFYSKEVHVALQTQGLPMSNEPNSTPPKKSNAVLLISILIGVPVLLTCCCSVGVGGWWVFFRSGALGVPGFSAAKLDTGNVENTRAWAEKSVARLKELEAKGNRAATDAEVAKLEKEMRDALEGKQIRWSLVIEGVRDDGEVNLAQFFGKDDGRFKDGEDAGKKRRKLYMRIYLEGGGDEVRIGDEINRSQAAKGSRFTLQRKVIEVNIRQRDENWSSHNTWTDTVEVLDTFCVDIIVKRE
jgi:hypothetical protein